MNSSDNREIDRNVTTRETETSSVKKECCGIYGLRNKVNGKWYVGQSVNIYSRWNEYRSGRCRRQKKISNALLKYGTDNFEWNVLEECQPKQLNEREIHWISKMDSVKYGYNLTAGGQGGSIRNGMTHTPETIAKIKKSLTGRSLSQEHKESIRRTLTGKVRANVPTYLTGRKQHQSRVSVEEKRLKARLRQKKYMEKRRLMAELSQW